MVAGLGLRSGDLKRLLGGKMVMVGGQFRASNDWVESPVHGQAPGVQYHAMALDNLIEDGDEYRRNTSTLFDSDLLKSLLVAALAFCGVLGVMVRNNLLDRAVAGGAEARLRARVYGPLYVLMFAVSISVVVVATWIGVTYAHRAPINWIGISACAIGFLFYATRQTLPADLIGSVEHLPAVRRVLAMGRLARRWMKFEEDRLMSPRASRPATPHDPISAKETPSHVEI
jgi:CHASE2 domain-containing sensor protein